MADDEAVSEVVDFIDDKDKALKALKKAIEYEKNNECSDDCGYFDRDKHGISCWSPGSDVPMSPYYIGAMKNSIVTDTIVDTNNHTVLSLSNLEACEKAVKQIEDKPEKHTDKWADKEVKQSNTSIQDILEDVHVSEKERKQIKGIVNNTDALEYWHDYIAPDVKYRSKAKKAILIMLASPRDKYGNKGRINVFMYGEPGTGKSLFKSFLKEQFDAITIDGPRVSAPDLTYNKKSGDFGKLPQAHKGILVVEEADEMDGELLGSTLTSFGESGRIEIRDMEIPAKARGVMLSNFESRREIIDEWSAESLNRFDFTIHFKKLDDDKKSDTLDWHYEHFRKPNPNDNENLIKKYIKIVREHTPTVGESQAIKKYKDEHVGDIDNVRQGISLMNIAWTIARLNLEDVKLKHYKQAFKLAKSNKALSEKF